MLDKRRDVLRRARGGKCGRNTNDDHVVARRGQRGQVDLVAGGVLLEDIEVREGVADLDESRAGGVEGAGTARAEGGEAKGAEGTGTGRHSWSM